MAVPKVALEMATVWVPVTVAVPANVTVTFMGVAASCGDSGAMTPVAVNPLAATLFVLMPRA